MADLRTKSVGYGIVAAAVALALLWSFRGTTDRVLSPESDTVAAQASNAVERQQPPAHSDSDQQASEVAHKAGAAIRQQTARAVDRALRAHAGSDQDGTESEELEGDTDVVRPSEEMPSVREFRDAFATLEQQRRSAPHSEPDLDLAEGLLRAIDAAQTPMDRFGLINAYLDEIAGIDDPAQALAARKRLAEVGAAPDALFVGDSAG